MQKQILVVDDEMVMRSLVAIAMQRNGYNVTQMDNPYKALSHLDQDIPDLIVLDLMMPGMSGIELCRHIRDRSGMVDIPIVIFSARDDQWQVKEAIKAGATAYIHKLQPSCDLVDTVNNLLAEVSAAAM